MSRTYRSTPDPTFAKKAKELSDEDLKIGGDVEIDGNVHVNSDVSVDGTFYAGGEATFEGDVAINGTNLKIVTLHQITDFDIKPMIITSVPSSLLTTTEDKVGTEEEWEFINACKNCFIAEGFDYGTLLRQSYSETSSEIRIIFSLWGADERLEHLEIVVKKYDDNLIDTNYFIA